MLNLEEVYKAVSPFCQTEIRESFLRSIVMLLTHGSHAGAAWTVQAGRGGVKSHLISLTQWLLFWYEHNGLRKDDPLIFWR